MVLEKLDIHMQKKKKKNESRHRLYTLHKANLKWIRDINIKYKTVRFPEDSMEGKLDKLGYDDDLLGTTPEVQPMRETIDKLSFTKKKKKLFRDFPGGPVAKTLFSQCRELDPTCCN